MANPIIRIKRSSVPGKIPNPSQVPLGEIALNTYDGKVFASRNVGIGTTVFVVNPWTVGTGTNTYNTYFTEGNVGIGSTIPAEKLDVLGNARISENLILGTSGINSITSIQDIAGWEYFGNNFSVASQDTNPVDLYFKDDGTKMFVVGFTNDRVNEYALSTAWDITSAGFTTFFSTSSQDTDPFGLYFKPDGTAMYVSGLTGVAGAGLVASADYVHQYTLSTPWSIAAGSVGYTTSFRILEESAPQGCFISTDGTKMFVIGSTNDRVYQYNLSTPWSLAAGNVSFGSSISIASQEIVPTGIDFNSTGTAMWICGSNTDRIQQYNLSTPWDITTAVFYDSVYVGFQELNPQGVYVEPSQNKAFIVGNTGDRVYEYRTNTPAIDLSSSGISTASAIILRNEARVLDNLSVRGAFNVNSTALFNNPVTAESTFTNNATLIHTGTTASLNNTTAASTLNLATGATGSTVQKTINVGTGGASGSRLLVNIGSETAGTASTVVVNSGTDVLIGAATTTGTASQPLQVTGGAYVSGNLGVGATNPSDKLHVLSGNIRVDSTIGALTFWSGAGFFGGIGMAQAFGGSGTDLNLRSDTNRNIVFRTGGANERVRITSTGNVGIGITNPSSRLHVLANGASGYAATFDNDGNNANRFGIRIQCGVDTGAGTAVAIDDGDGTNQGNITFNAGTVTYGAFTANHDCVIPSYEGEIPYGTLIITNEILYKKRPSGEEMERGILYSAGISTTPYSKRLLGSYSYAYDLDSPVQSGSDLPVHQVLVLGDGHILCCGEKGNIKFGDGITSSSREGIGMKMDKIGLVIGIAQEDVEFEEDEVKLVPVQYGLHQYIPDNIAEYLEELMS